MIYSVVPRPLADELYPKLVEHYKNNENVTVIVDRRKADRRGAVAAQAAWTGTPPAGSASCAIAAAHGCPATCRSWRSPEPSPSQLAPASSQPRLARRAALASSQRAAHTVPAAG